MTLLAADELKRRVLLTILVLGWTSSISTWAVVEFAGTPSTALRVVFGLNAVFNPVMAAAVWWRLLPLRVVDLACLSFVSGVCAACMALRFYAPAYGADIDLQPLYLWIPVIYVFAFTLPTHALSLKVSLGILLLFIGISLPHLVQSPEDPLSNVTVQMHFVSAVLIAALYFFASYQYRFRLAQLTAEDLARLANTDDLTNLANRRRMTEAIQHELARHARYGNVFSLIVFDVDHFKSVNDRFGHSVGDQSLVALAKRTQELLRDADTLGRWGGEEFLVILPQTRFEETLRKAEQLCRHVEATPLFAYQTVTISCGVTSVAAGDTTDTMLRRADVALYSAKQRGRNRVEGLFDLPAVTAR